MEMLTKARDLEAVISQLFNDCERINTTLSYNRGGQLLFGCFPLFILHKHISKANDEDRHDY